MKEAHERGIENGYLTVYLALCLTLVVSLCLTLIEGARRNGAGMQAMCVAEIGLQSIMAEYHRELMNQYNLFAIDASYGTALCSKANTEEHLQSYLEKNLSYEDIFLADFFYRDFFGLELEEAELTRVSILTDYRGAVFRRCAAEAIKSDVGLELLEKLLLWTKEIKVNGLEDGVEWYEQELNEELEDYEGTGEEIKENDWGTVIVEHTTAGLEEKKRLGILKLVTDEEELSSNAINTEGLIESRMQQGMVNQGNMELSGKAGAVQAETEQAESVQAEAGQTEAEQLAERFLFQEYLLQYMGHYGAENEEDALKYQIEYIVAGKNNDVENLRTVANRICLIREAANAIYLFSDTEKKLEIKLLAEVVCGLIAQPELVPIVEGIILLGWAYAESVYDVETLLDGEKIPLFKDSQSWHYGLAAALSGEWQEDGGGENGLGYEDYLRIFMMFADVDTLTGRAMNMVEADIRNTPGNAAFRLDGCYEALEAYIKYGSDYGYQYEITRQKQYN